MHLNLAGATGRETVRVGPIEIYDLNVEEDRERIVEAISEASELTTAVSSVADYASAHPGSIHRLLARGLTARSSRQEYAVIYASENNTAAASLLAEAVYREVPERLHETFRCHNQFVDTVIGKMSRTVSDPTEIANLALTVATPGSDRAFLVETFHTTLVDAIRFGKRPEVDPVSASVPRHDPESAREPESLSRPDFALASQRFEQKQDLAPFEEAKLYGHNATHALAAYLGYELGVTHLADLADVTGFMDFLRSAALYESGLALLRRHSGKDPFFTPDAFAQFTEQLIGRMLNPYLNDTTRRVGRDPLRKLGWNDRLVGTIRMAMRAGVSPERHALGAAAALAFGDASLESLSEQWPVADSPEKTRVMACIETGQRRLIEWRTERHPPLEPFFLRYG